MGFVSDTDSWRLAMVVPGSILLVMAFVYHRYTADTPAGNFKDLEKADAAVRPKKGKTALVVTLRDYRIWVLTLAYAACFGIEITVDNVAALFFIDSFGTSLIKSGRASCGESVCR